jgi:hypothetical protein
MVHHVRSRRPLYSSILGIGAIALSTVACGGFDVPSWTRPAGPSSSTDETEPSLDDTKAKSLDDNDGGARDAQPATPASDAGDGGDAGPKDAALG